MVPISDTKERILLAALELFARDGYEAVSISDIAGKMGITKGALYRHYAGKWDIFDSIVRRMEQRDARQAAQHDLPEGTPEEMEAAYRSASIDDMAAFGKAMFRYWTQDSFAAPFRRMLTLEQFRSPEMAGLYQQYLAAGPLGYVTDLLAALEIPRPQADAARFYAPMFLLYSVYDGAEDKAAVLSLVDGLLDDARERLNALKSDPMKREGRE